MLFLELALIRWLGANIVHLGYFSNIVLLGSFLGVGLGFLRSGTSRAAPAVLPGACSRALVVLVRLVPVTVERGGTTSSTSPPCPPPARPCGSRCRRVPRRRRRDGRPRGARRGLLPAAGTARGLPLRPDRQPRGHRGVHRCCRSCGPRPSRGAPSWPSRRRAARAVGAVPACSFTGRRPRVGGRAHRQSLTPGVVVVAVLQGDHDRRAAEALRAVDVSVNGVPHQTIVALGARLRSEPSYALPYLRVPRDRRATPSIIGAGDGVDVDLALPSGAKQCRRRRHRSTAAATRGTNSTPTNRTTTPG